MLPRTVLTLSLELTLMESSGRLAPQALADSVTVESSHNYPDSVDYSGFVTIQGASKLRISFDPRCHTESSCDYIDFWAGPNIAGQRTARKQGAGASRWKDLILAGPTVKRPLTPPTPQRPP